MYVFNATKLLNARIQTPKKKHAHINLISAQLLKRDEIHSICVCIAKENWSESVVPMFYNKNENRTFILQKYNDNDNLI